MATIVTATKAPEGTFSGAPVTERAVAKAKVIADMRAARAKAQASIPVDGFTPEVCAWLREQDEAIQKQLHLYDHYNWR